MVCILMLLRNGMVAPRPGRPVALGISCLHGEHASLLHRGSNSFVEEK